MKTTLKNLLILLVGILAIQLLTSCTTVCGLQQSNRTYFLNSPYLDYTVFDDYGELVITTQLPICDDAVHLLTVPDCGEYAAKEITREAGERSLIFSFNDTDFFCIQRQLNEASLSLCQPHARH